MTPGQNMRAGGFLPPNQTGGHSHNGHIWVRSPPVARACRLSRFVDYTGSHESHSYFGGSGIALEVRPLFSKGGRVAL